MKGLIALFLLFLQDVTAQEYTRKTGLSDCTSDTIILNDIPTLITEYHPNGKEAKKVRVHIYDECRIQDTTIMLFDTLGNLTTMNRGKYTTYLTYDNAGLIQSETTMYSIGDTQHQQFEYTKKQGVVETLTIVGNGVVHSVTQYSKRKKVTEYRTKRMTEVRKYDRNGRLKLLRTKAKVNEEKNSVLKERNKYNKLGNLTESVFKENGKTKVRVKVLYKNGVEWLESRILYETGTIITTEYQYE